MMNILSLSTLLLAACPRLAAADTHYLFSGFFSGASIVGLEYDDASSSLSLVNNITTTATSGSKWISLDERRNNLYVATTGYFQSYAITSDLGLEYQSNVSLSSNCTNANFITAATAEPYTVFGAPYSSGCSSLAMSVDSTGSLQTSFANLTYDSSAGVHGLALSPQNDFVYSADDMGDAVWVHSYNSSSAVVVEEVQRIAAPTGANPRHLAVHPRGLFVYVIYEELNELAVFTRNKATGELVNTNVTYPLIPPSFTNTSSYWADEVEFSIPSGPKNSTSPKYLLTGTRSHKTSSTGYVSAFALDPITGNITSQLFLLPTTGSGGAANAVSPAVFSEEYFAITDSGSNFIEVWKIESNNNDNDNNNGSTTASVAAHLDLESGPANVVWYS